MKRIRKGLAMVLCLCVVLVLMPMTAFAGGMENYNTLTGKGTWDLDIDNKSTGIIVHGKYLRTVYNNGGLILGDTFNIIVDDGSGRYGLKMKLTNLTASVALPEYESEKYAIMPYNTDFSFVLSADSGYALPSDITISKGASELTSGVGGGRTTPTIIKPVRL